MSYPVLLTPGPLTTSARTKEAMLSDWGSWDVSFNQLTASVCKDIVDIVKGQGSHVCVPMQGSGTFSVEAALGSLVPKTGKVLVPANGAYCQRIARILGYLKREVVVLEHGEDETQCICGEASNDKPRPCRDRMVQRPGANVVFPVSSHPD